MRRLLSISRLCLACAAPVLAASISLFCAETAAAQQTKTIFCFADGTTIGAERFETRDGKFYIYVTGSATPLEYPASMVRGIDSPQCAAVPPIPVPAAGHFGIQGSNTIGERLMPLLIESYAVKKLGQRPAVKPGSEPEAQEISLRSGAETKAVIDFKAKGSGTAPKALVEGKALIGMMSRQMKNDEADSVKAKFGVDPLAPGNEHVLALDGLAVIVNETNPVRRLTLDKLCGMFSGAISNWRDVGGADQPIALYRRDNKSGTFDTFKHLVLDPSSCGKPISVSARAFESSEQLSESVFKDPNGVGFVAIPYVGKNRAVEIDSSCGVVSAPSRFSIKSEEYPLARRLYLYTIGAPSDPVAQEILHFALSDEAQSVVTDAEFYNLAVEFEDEADQRRWAQTFAEHPTTGLPPGKEAPGVAVRAFQAGLALSRRATLEFRFQPGSAALDTRALADVKRLATYLQSSEAAGKHFKIIGFADADGGWTPNDRLARQRAQSVVDHLSQAGVRVPSRNLASFSYLAPVACNDTEAGKAKNRRVEIWIER